MRTSVSVDFYIEKEASESDFLLLVVCSVRRRIKAEGDLNFISAWDFIVPFFVQKFYCSFIKYICCLYILL